jgi:hypothetical protein
MENENRFYRSFGHCMVFAIEDASVYFNKTSLDTSYVNTYLTEITQARKLNDEIKAGDKGIGWRLTLQMIVDKLVSIGIKPTELLTTEYSKKLIGDINGESGPLPFKAPTTHLDTKFPAVLGIEYSDAEETHVWFCPSSDVYRKDKYLHIGKTGKLVAAISLTSGAKENTSNG